MKKEKNLLLARNIFTFSIVIIFTIIIVSEKKETIMIPKIEKKINQYIEENYSKEDLQQSKVIYKNDKYRMKVSSKKNKNRYFYVYYFKKNITDTYQEDYIKGKTILTNIEKKLQKEIKEKTNKTPIIEINTTLDQFTDSVAERILEEENLLELKIYTIKDELIIEKWNTKEITLEIENYISTYNKENITPKNYIITITNQNEITNSIEISNITSDFINNPRKEEIINDIIINRNSSLLKDNKIIYKYKN